MDIRALIETEITAQGWNAEDPEIFQQQVAYAMGRVEKEGITETEFGPYDSYLDAVTNIVHDGKNSIMEIGGEDY